VTQPLFELNTRELADRDPAVVVVEVSGEIDAINVAEFTHAIDGVKGRRPLVMDLSALDYVDSAGFAAVERLLAREVVIVVLDPRSAIRAAAKLIELPCYDSVEAALG
jgi:anti-anti-sigma factor